MLMFPFLPPLQAQDSHLHILVTSEVILVRPFGRSWQGHATTLAHGCHGGSAAASS